ncbi:MAG: tyrosine-type recombinase/integrase [Acidimicrobiia bacterium]
MTLKTFLEKHWLPAITSTIRKSTHHGYTAHVRTHIVPRLGRKQLAGIDGPALNSLYAELLAGGRHDGKGGLAPATVRRVHATLHRAFRDAVRWGYLTENPADRCDPPRQNWPTASEKNTWTPTELSRFLDHVRDDDLCALWFVFAMTGLRRGEAIGLRWKDVDLQGKVIAIRQTLVQVGRELTVSTPKTARGSRVVAIDGATVKVLMHHRETQLLQGVRHDDLVFRRNGKPLDPRWVSKRFRSLVWQARLPRIRLHDLRHTHATLALKAGIHPKIVSERLGHSTISFTLDVYSHALPSMQAEAADQIASLVLDS